MHRLSASLPVLPALLLALLTVASGLAGGVGPAAAGSDPAVVTRGSDLVEARILPGWRAPDGTHMAALELRLREGWKTYWRAPGEVGIPPQFDWRRSRNLAGVEPIWPTPEITETGGLRSIGYHGTLVLPLRLTTDHAGRDIALEGSIELGVCKDVCMPVTINVSGTLPKDATRPDPRIAAALASRPYSAAEAGVVHVACRVSPIPDGIGLRAEIDLPPTGGREMAVFELEDPRIWASRTETRRRGGRLVAETRLYHVDGRAFALDRSGIRITVLGQSRAVDIQGCPAG